MRLLLKSLLAIFLLAFLSSCESDPVEIGEGLLPDGDRVIVTDVVSDTLDWTQYSYSYLNDSLNLGSADRLILGQFVSTGDQSYTVTSQILIQWYFSLADTIVDQIDSGELIVNSAWVTLKPDYNVQNYNDLDFSVYRINEEWNPTDFYIENLNALEKGTENLFEAFIDEGKTDSLVTFSVANELADSWLQIKADTSLPDKNYGLLLTPNASMKTNVGFFSANASITDFNPTFYIEYQRTIDSTGLQYYDTLYSSLVMFDTHVNEFSDGLVLNPSGKMVLHTGIPSLSSFFIDVSSIPKNSLINKAELFLTVDTTKSQFAIPRSDTLFFVAYTDSVERKLSSTMTPGYLLNKEGVFSGSITNIIQNWVRDAENMGGALSLADTDEAVSRVEFYNSSASDKAVRPKVKIVYTTIPGQ